MQRSKGSLLSSPKVKTKLENKTLFHAEKYFEDSALGARGRRDPPPALDGFQGR